MKRIYEVIIGQMNSKVKKILPRLHFNFNEKVTSATHFYLSCVVIKKNCYSYHENSKETNLPYTCSILKVPFYETTNSDILNEYMW